MEDNTTSLNKCQYNSFIVNKLKSEVDFETIYTNYQIEKRRDKYRCVNYNKFKLKIYDDNKGYCFKCQWTFDNITLIKYIEQTTYLGATKHIMENYYSIQQTNSDIESTIEKYRKLLYNIHYTRLLKYYIKFNNVKKLHEYINVSKSTFNHYINFRWNEISNDKISDIVSKLKQHLKYDELICFVLWLKLEGLNEYGNWLKCVKLYCDNNYPELWDLIVHNTKLNRMTYNRIINGNKVHKLEQYKVIIDNTINTKHFRKWINNLDNIIYDEQILKKIIKNSKI